MPKKGKNKGKHCGRQRSISHNAADVTLSDFANAMESRSVPIVRKFTSIPILHEEAKKSWDELDWFDRDLADYGDEEQSNNQNSDCENETPQYFGAAVKKRQRRHTGGGNGPSSSDNEVTNCYPSDLWFVLSDYVRPEDVGRFASICKDTYKVTCTSRFWIRLYNRHKFFTPELPIRLQPHCIALKFDGLRASVIRALYYFYATYVEKYKLNQQQEAHCLVMRKCATTWHQRGRYLHTYFFKMEDQSEKAKQFGLKSLKKNEETHYKSKLGNIFANSEEKFKVLQITTPNFVAVPPSVMGETLVYVSCVLSADLRSHNLRLVFGPSHAQHYYRKGKRPNSNVPDGCTEILLTSVVLTKVLNWWSPNYPCTSAEVGSLYDDRPRNGVQQLRQSDLYF